MNKLNNYNRFLILALFIFCIGCKKNERDKVVLHENITTFSEFPEEINISFEEIYEYKSGTPKALKLVDSTLIIFNSTKKIESFFYNYNLNDGYLSKGYLKKGRGPNEALGASCFGIMGNKFWVYDVTLKRLVLIDKTNATSANVSSVETYSIKEGLYQLALIDSTHFLVSGKIDSKYKFQKENFSEEILHEFGEFGHIPEDMPLDALKDAYHSFFFLNPYSNKLAVSYLYTDVLEIYDLKNTSNNKAVQGPSIIDIDFEIGRRQYYNYMEKNEEIRKTFLAGSVTENYIYLAYSGISYAEKENIDYCKSVFVYDWDGNPIKKINLDRRIMGLAISEDDKTMYSYNPDTGFIVKAEIGKDEI